MTVELVGRRELVEDLRARGGAHALGAEQILDAERNAFERTALTFREPRIGGARHVARVIRRLLHEGIERARRLDRADVGVGQFKRGDVFLAQPLPGLGQRQRGQVGHISRR